MSNYRQSYAALTPSSSRAEVTAVLQSITDGERSPFARGALLTRSVALMCNDRGELIQMILDDITPLTKSSSSSKSRLTSKGVPLCSARLDELLMDMATAMQTLHSLYSLSSR